MPPILFGLRLELILGHRCCIIDRGIVIVYRDCRDHAPTLPSEPWPTIPSRLRTPGISCPPSLPLHYLSLRPLLPRKAKHFQACLSACTRCDHFSVPFTWTSVVWTVCFRCRCSSTPRFIETLPHPACTRNFVKSVIPDVSLLALRMPYSRSSLPALSASSSEG